MAPAAARVPSTGANGTQLKTKRNLLDDSESESDGGGAPVGDTPFTVNEEYARRFEHNKKREERHRCK